MFDYIHTFAQVSVAILDHLFRSVLDWLFFSNCHEFQFNSFRGSMRRMFLPGVSVPRSKKSTIHLCCPWPSKHDVQDQKLLLRMQMILTESYGSYFSDSAFMEFRIWA